MASTIVDSVIFGDVFSTEAMRQVRSDEDRTQKYLDIEAAVARVQGRLGVIPTEAADEMVRHSTLDQIDMTKLKAQTERIGYPILGVVSQLNAPCRDKLGARSNLQQAVPITFGFKMAELLCPIERHRERLVQLRTRVLMGEFGAPRERSHRSRRAPWRPSRDSSHRSRSADVSSIRHPLAATCWRDEPSQRH